MESVVASVILWCLRAITTMAQEMDCLYHSLHFIFSVHVRDLRLKQVRTLFPKLHTIALMLSLIYTNFNCFWMQALIVDCQFRVIVVVVVVKQHLRHIS